MTPNPAPPEMPDEITAITIYADWPHVGRYGYMYTAYPGATEYVRKDLAPSKADLDKVAEALENAQATMLYLSQPRLIKVDQALTIINGMRGV